jgi:hypothetical protein
LSAFKVIASLPSNTVTYTDRSVKNGAAYRYRVSAQDSDEYSAYSDEVVPGATSQIANTSAISIYPNAASSMLTITTKGEEQRVVVNIMSLQGIVFEKIELNERNSTVGVNVSSWPEGLYIVESISSNYHFREQLIIRR